MLSSLRRMVLSPSLSEHMLLQRRMRKETQVGIHFYTHTHTFTSVYIV